VFNNVVINKWGDLSTCSTTLLLLKSPFIRVIYCIHTYILLKIETFNTYHFLYNIKFSISITMRGFVAISVTRNISKYRIIRYYTVSRPEPLTSETVYKIKNELQTKELKCEFDIFNNHYKHYHDVRNESFLDMFKDFTKVIFCSIGIVGLFVCPEIYRDWKSRRHMLRRLEEVKLKNKMKSIVSTKN
jgi:hypothetical protein